MEVGFQNQFLENAGRSPQIPDKKVGRRSYPWPEKELGGGKELDFIRDQRDCWRRPSNHVVCSVFGSWRKNRSL